MSKGRILLAVLLIFIISLGFECSAGYVIAENGLCVRKTPSDSGEVLEVLSFGTRVPNSKEGWVKYRGGYINSEWVSDRSPLSLIGEWHITAYADTGCCCANGEYPEVGETIAQNTLPFGTKVYIEGVGVRTVEDRGPSSLGSEWCDLYLGDAGSCIAWGNQCRKVYKIVGDKKYLKKIG